MIPVTAFRRINILSYQTQMMTVSLLNADGNFLYKFGNDRDEDVELKKHRCLSVDKAGHFMVRDFLNHTVQVLELNGKFITKFGRYGSEIGELNAPRSTAVLSDGRIVVTDFDNIRIQIIE